MPNERRFLSISVQVGAHRQTVSLNVPMHKIGSFPTLRLIDMIHARAITLFYLALNEIENDIATDKDIWEFYKPDPQEHEG